MGLLRSLVLLVLAAAQAAAAMTAAVTVDPRVELLGVVQHLSGRRPEAPYPYDPALLDRRFGRYRSHPAVAAFARLAEKNPEGVSLGMIILAASDPPALALERPLTELSRDFIAAAGGAPAVERFLADLRSFARESRYMAFFAERRADHERVRQKAVRAFESRGELKKIERYLGLDLDSRCRFILSLLFQPGRYTAYIIPYPYLGPGRLAKGPFDVYHLVTPRDGDYHFDRAFAFGYWNEILYLAAEAGAVKHGPELEKLKSLHAAARGCPPAWLSCANHVVVTALARRLDPEGAGRLDGPLEDYVAAIASELEAYEKDRKRYPSLLDFYPRIVEAFRGLEGRRK